MFGRVALVVALAGCSSELTFATKQLPEGKVGVPYHVEIEFENRETPLASVRAVGLPAGLTLEFVEHRRPPSIEGTPTAAGTSTVTIEASCFGTNSAGKRGQHTYQLVIR